MTDRTLSAIAIAAGLSLLSGLLGTASTLIRTVEGQSSPERGDRGAGGLFRDLPTHLEEGSDVDATLLGASASWSGSGAATLAEDDTSPVTNLVLTAPPDQDAGADVLAEAVLGYVSANLIAGHWTVPAGTSTTISIPVSDALSLHPNQADHPTTVRAMVKWSFEGTSRPITQFMEHRSLVFDPGTGTPLLYDPQTFASTYPDGMLTDEARARRSTSVALAEAESNGEDGTYVEVAPGAGSGVYLFVPEDGL